MRYLPLLALFIFLFAACGSDTAAEQADTTTEEEAAPPSEPVAGVAISPKPAAVDFPGATITSMSYQDGVFRFQVDDQKSGYQLGAQTPDAESAMCANSAKGQHIHLIVGDAPYAAKYEAEFDYEIADGSHYLMAFLSRSYHESIKHNTAFKAMEVEIKDNSIAKMAAIPSPMLFYSRPKGTYTGKDTENIMLDFYPVNTNLGMEHLIKVEVAGQSFTVDKWQPYFLTGLPMGENTVTLTLTDMEGKAVEAPHNPVSRTFTLAPTPDQVQ